MPTGPHLLATRAHRLRRLAFCSQRTCTLQRTWKYAPATLATLPSRTLAPFQNRARVALPEPSGGGLKLLPGRLTHTVCALVACLWCMPTPGKQMSVRRVDMVRARVPAHDACAGP